MIPREVAHYVGPFLEHEVREKVNNSYPFLIGGDHSLTYFSCKALTSIYGPLNIIVFDAHHDAYPEPNLNHYTVFHHIKRLFHANVTMIGCRYDRDEPAFKDLSTMSSPCYLSVDVDYFSANLVPSVMDSVPCKEGDLCTFSSFERTLASLKCPIIGADIVEWKGADPTTQEYQFVSKVFHHLVEKVERNNQCEKEL